MTPTPPWFDGFEARDFDVAGMRIHARLGGTVGALALLLLHGFPQTHALWHRVAQQLAPHFALVLPDLRGYGDSAKPVGDADHANYSKRAMAQDLAALMQQLGHARYGVCGHDRGGRVAHRLALDHPAAVTRLAVIDIAPTLDMYSATDQRFASAYYHWFHLIQPTPLPEQMILGCWRDYLHTKLGRWGATSGPQDAGASAPRGGGSALGRPGGGLVLPHIEPQALAEYERCFARPETVHAMCEDYRASAGIDLEHDRASRAAGAKVACDMRVLWGQRGVVNALFDPLALWRAQCSGDVQGECLPAGHYIPEELPEATAAQLMRFFTPA
jgi:haloacetate dehalogenase